jgi:hypothetical protein
LLETIAAQLSPNPFVQTLEFKPKGRVAVVGKPSNQEQIEFDNHLRQANAPVATGDLPDFLLRTVDALGSDPKLAVPEQPMAGGIWVPLPERKRSYRG